MAIQNGLAPRPGGNFSQLSISTPTVLKVGPGTFYNINVLQFNQADGYLYDAASIATINYASCLLRINPVALTAGSSDLAGAGPFPFLLGLIFVPGVDGMIASISWS